MSNPFDDAAALVRRLKLTIGPSEAHGLLCGLLCSQPPTTAKTRWFTELLEAGGISAAAISAQASDIKALDAWFGDTIKSLNAAELDFNALLPAEPSPVLVRASALIEFCAGFTYGLGVGLSAQGNRSLPADTQELLHDFQAIENTDIDQVAANDESAFTELSEYVRVGVLLIHEELQPVIPVAGANSAKPQVH